MNTVIRAEPARMFRGKIPICWMLAILQSLGACDWIQEFYSRRSMKNLLNRIFDFIHDLRYQGPNFTATQNKNLAQKIVE